MERLGLESRHFRRPLKLEPPEVFERFWVLRFLASRAQLLVGREVFALEDPRVREAIEQRWADWPAAVIYAGPPERIPAPPDAALTLTPEGHAETELLSEAARLVDAPVPRESEEP
jgi:hypothetical protein